MFAGTTSLAVVCQPARSSSRMAWAPPGDRPGDLVEMRLHGVCVGEGHGERGADAACRADRSEEVGALIALVGGLARPGSAPRPLPDAAVILADTGLVLEPKLDVLALGDVGEMGLQRRCEAF